MSMSEWMPDGVRQYERAIKASLRQKAAMAKRKEQWLNDFIDGKPVKQFDEFVAQNIGLCGKDTKSERELKHDSK